jgi:ABC-type spermidine/putrescine transport system permease subunit II
MRKEFKILIPIGLLLLANFALAQVDIEQMIEDIINYVINVVIICAGIIIVIGGYLMVTSAGNPEQFEKGKKTLLYGAIGFILVFAARELATEILNVIKGQ